MNKIKALTASLAILLTVPLLFGACSYITGDTTLAPSVSAEGFAIYLTRDDVPPATMEILSYVEIAGTPVISEDDIIEYNWVTHEITLTEAGWNRIQDIQPPVAGTSFVVCVNRAPLYWGTFWTPVSYQAPRGVVISTPTLTSTTNTIRLELGYPYSLNPEDDPRDNPDVKTALETAGKLIGGETGLTGTGFEIYLTKNAIPLEEMRRLDQAEISDEPVIGTDDIKAYCWETHEMEITEAAFNRIMQGPKDVAGTVFIACVDRQPVYWGAFWSHFSSSMPYCVHIERPPAYGDRVCIVTIEDGYNDNIIYGGDPRYHLVIYNALAKTNKLTGPLVVYPTDTVTREPEGLALYLTKEFITTDVNMSYSWPEREDTPVIAQKDIVSYSYVTHEMTLTQEAYQRLLQLEIPVEGRSFLFTREGSPIWWGFFWTSLSSISYDGYVICLQSLDDLPENTIRIDYGYPAPYTPPRSDIRKNLCLELLQAEGKLAEPLVLFTFPETEPVQPEGVAVYLIADNVSLFDLSTSRNITVGPEPLIAADEILEYNLATHQMTLSPSAIARLNALETGLNGLAFVLCVDGAPVYWGALWNGDFRMIFDGPVLGAFPYLEKENTVAISFGMTGNITHWGEDPRGNALIIEALEKAGNLR